MKVSTFNRVCSSYELFGTHKMGHFDVEERTLQFRGVDVVSSLAVRKSSSSEYPNSSNHWCKSD